MKRNFLPTNRMEMEKAGWDRPDFVYVCGDAYVDHPSFGSAIISRVLESRGYRVAMMCQPDWRDSSAIREFGEPRLGFLVSSGNMDSMVNHYTVAKKRRKTDAYSPGGEIGHRPDRAVIVYCNWIRQTFKKTPIILGGLEASLRRLGHYDYWSNKVRRSILLESGADLLIYGMGEHSIVEIADALDSGLPVQQITYVDGTVFKTRDPDWIYDGIKLPSFEEICADKRAYANSFRMQYENTDAFQAKRLFETYDGALFVVQNPPTKPLTQLEMDDVYALPYARAWHPKYDEKGGIPAFAEIKFSITSNRGCFGGCNFCALTFHQGRIVQARSEESILAEAREFLEEPDFKGNIFDVGGPTADFMQPACKKQATHGACKNRQCLFPEPCPQLNANHKKYISVLRKLRALPGVKRVFVRSGIRFDYVLADSSSEFLKELCAHHISGQLRVAPEHVSDRVLTYMGKPKFSVYRQFEKAFEKMNRTLKKEQYMLPYLMSSHPGSTLKDAIVMAEYLRDLGYMPEQVQDFYPTPGTISTCMYYTGIHPLTMEPVYVPKSPHEKAMQRALIQFRRPENYDLVREALLKEGREDLIGFDKKCLIPPGKRKVKASKGKNPNLRNSHQRGNQRHGNNRKKRR